LATTIEVAMALPAGTQRGPYQILSLIGAGGMGEVYRARDTRLNRIVALKILPPHLASRGDLRERFEREVTAFRSSCPLVAGRQSGALPVGSRRRRPPCVREDRRRCGDRKACV
jgi:hypothetical protein